MAPEPIVCDSGHSTTPSIPLLDGGAIALCLVAGLYGVSQYWDVSGSSHLTAGGLILVLVFWIACGSIIATHALTAKHRTMLDSRRLVVFLLTLGVIPTLYAVSYFHYLPVGSTAGMLTGALSGAYLFARFRPRISRHASVVFAALYLGASIFFVLQDVCFDILTMDSQTLTPRIRRGDKVAINKLAFGLRVPFWSRYLISWADPAPGELVVFLLEDGRLFVKEVIRIDGHLTEVKDIGIVRQQRLRGRVVAAG